MNKCQREFEKLAVSCLILKKAICDCCRYNDDNAELAWVFFRDGWQAAKADSKTKKVKNAAK